MKNPAVLFDADGTLYDGFSIFPLYEAFESEGYVSREDNNRLQELLGEYKSGKMKYPDLVLSTLIASADTLKGRRVDVANSLSEMFFSGSDFPWFGYVRPFFEEMHEAKAKLGLITAEPQFVAWGIAKALGIDEKRSSQFGVDSDGKTYRGDLVTSLNSSIKGEAAKVIVNGKPSTAFGDSEGDLGMFEVVDRPICIRPMKNLRKQALSRGWTIVDNPNKPLLETIKTTVLKQR